MLSTKNDLDSNPWTEDPSIAYKNFLQSAGEEVNASISYNRNILSMFGSSKKEEPKLEVHAHNGAFYPLGPCLKAASYCSKITIRNIESAALWFQFAKDIIPGILSIDTYNKDIKKNFQIAYRNIVPREFAQATQLAGPMGFHEYIIDGRNYKNGNLPNMLSFVANSDFNETPIKIVLENCKGKYTIEGLDENEIKRVFENKCKTDELTLVHIGPTKGMSNKF